MYIPIAFRADDPDVLHAFIRQHSFATLVTGGKEPFVTHLPILIDPERGEKGTLVGHFARPNPHWQLDHQQYPSVAIFHGPHGYISPSWYRSGLPAVPTWNYAAVHAIGRLRIVHDVKQVTALLDRSVAAFEGGRPRPWINPMRPEMNEKLIGGVVAFEMPIDRLDGKFKLGQNRNRDDQLGAVDGLEASADAESVRLAAFMRSELGI